MFLSLLAYSIFTETACEVYGQPRYYVNVRPRPVYFAPPPRPYGNSIWIEGNWNWGGAGYVWQPGYWAAPRPHYRYRNGYWANTRRGYGWVQGGWYR